MSVIIFGNIGKIMIMKKNIVINVDNQMDLILYLWGIQFVNPAKIIATIEAAFNKDYEIVG